MTRSKREILRKRRHSRISISAIVRVDLIIFFAAIYQYDFKKKKIKNTWRAHVLTIRRTVDAFLTRILG